MPCMAGARSVEDAKAASCLREAGRIQAVDMNQDAENPPQGQTNMLLKRLIKVLFKQSGVEPRVQKHRWLVYTYGIK